MSFYVNFKKTQQSIFFGDKKKLNLFIKSANDK